MIACIVIVSLAFLWLGLETNWLTIRLYKGAIPTPPPLVGREYTQNDICCDYGFKSWLGVLTGWEWAINHRDIIPQNTIEFNANGATHKVTPPLPLPGKGLPKRGIVKEVMQVYLKPHKPIYETYPPSHYAGCTIWRSRKLKARH